MQRSSGKMEEDVFRVCVRRSQSGAVERGDIHWCGGKAEGTRHSPEHKGHLMQRRGVQASGSDVKL